MRIEIRERNVAVAQVLRAHVERRLGFALGRFADQIGLVTVRFSDTDGARGGAGKICQITVALRRRTVRVEDEDADLDAALDHAASRVSRSVARALELGREWGAAPGRP